jgi:hypothetical protein
VTGRNRIVWLIAVGAMAGALIGARGQEVVPRAMTAEEIAKELESAAPMKGAMLHEGKLFCPFDSEKAQTLPEGNGLGQPATRVRTSPRPNLAVKLSRGSDPKRLLLVKDGKLDDDVAMRIASNPKDPSTYTVTFDKPLEAGKYEFALMQGKLVLWLRCGVTVAQK